MRYYEVFIAESGYQKKEPLTYSSETELPTGTIVLIPYGRKSVVGFVYREANKPEFKTKPIETTLTEKPLSNAQIELHKWMSEFYPSGSGAITQLFIPSSLKSKSRNSKITKKKKISGDLPKLTEEQNSVLSSIDNSTGKTYLLHGETGSGKTRIYFELAKQTLIGNKSVMILVPEISLVPQISEIFKNYFDDQVVEMHSGLTKSTRNKNWLKILNSSEPLIIIGTRSALFAPTSDLGIVVVDEMHEPAYKQESSPRYYALRVAARLARIHDAKIIYGSATPPVVEYFMAKKTGASILRMKQSAKESAAVKSTIIDLKKSEFFSRNRNLSDQLLSAVESRLKSGEQSLIFLNRRGSFRTIICQTCGWQAVCPNCDMPLTYHGDSHQLRCHTCGFNTSPPLFCPECSSEDIIYRSLGTKALVDSLHSLFPEANIRRFDTDNLTNDRLQNHFDSVKSGEIDILVGTQMLSKGLDLPKLSLVGIVNADTSLGVPDFSSAERSYQLLHQAIGRVGRGHVDGEVIIQTFNPDNPYIKAAVDRNWLNLYQQEIKERELFKFPPFYFLMKIAVSRKRSDTAETYINSLRSTLANSGLKLRIEHPTPSFYEKSHGMYNWQLIIRARDRSELIKAVNLLPKGDYIYDLDPINLL